MNANNHNHSNTDNGVPMPQLDFGETDTAPVTPAPAKSSKTPLLIALIVVLLAATTFAVTAFVWPGFLTEDRAAVTDEAEDEDEENTALTTTPTTVPTQPPEPRVQLEDMTGTWNVEVNVETVCRQLATADATQSALCTYMADLFKGYKVNVSVVIDEDGTLKAAIGKTRADGIVHDVYTRVAKLIQDREKFYAVAKLVMGVQTDAEVDSVLNSSMMTYDTIKMMVSAGLAEQMVTELIRTYADEWKVYDTKTNSYVFPPMNADPIKVTVKDGKLGLVGVDGTVDVKIEDGLLSVKTPEEEGTAPAWMALLDGVIVKKTA